MTLNRYNFGLFNSGTYIPYGVDITSISKGNPTTVTTSTTHRFQVGNLVQFQIPKEWGMRKLNALKAYVLSVPNDLQIIVDVNTLDFDDFLIPVLPPFVGVSPAQVFAVGDGNFNDFLPNNNTRLPRTIQGAFVNIPP